MEPSHSSDKEHVGDVYRCRGCRKILFTNFIHHNADCSSYFIDRP